jgi:tetratricopeptide (TPR) repeat protein
MSLLLHQFHKDGRRLRWLIALWTALILIQALVVMAAGLAPTGWAVHLSYELLATLLPLLQMLLTAVMVPLLVHEEPLVGTTAAWLTRPLSRPMLLASKAFFTVTVLVLPPLAAELAVLALNGARSELALAAAEILLIQCALVTAVAALAAVTPNFAHFITWAAVIWTVQALATGALMLGRMASNPESIWAWAEPSAFRSARIAALGGALVAGAVVVVHQYLTRRTRRSVVLGVAGIVAVTLLGMDRPPKPPGRPATTEGPGREVELMVDVDSVLATDAFSLQALAQPKKTISAKVECAGTPPGTFCDIEDLTASLRFPDGALIRVDRPHRPSFPRLHPPSIQQALGGASVVNAGLSSGLSGVSPDLFEVERAVYAERGWGPAVLEGSGTVTLKRYRVVARLPLKRGASHADGVEQTTITDVLRGPGSCQVVLRQRTLRLLLSGGSAPLQSLTATFFQPVSYVLVNPQRQQAFVPEMMPSFDFARILSQATPGGQRLSYDVTTLVFTSESRFQPLPPLDDAWLDGASLVALEAEAQGRAAARLLVPDFVLARSERGPVGRPSDVDAGLSPAQYYERGTARLEDSLGHSADQGRALGEAKAYLTKAAEADRRMTAAYVNLALVAAVSDEDPAYRRAAAKPWLDRARELRPADPGLQRVEAYLVDGEGGDPVPIAERLVAASPGIAAYWRDLGYFRSKAYRLRTALEAFGRALAARDGPLETARIHAQRAEAYAYLDRPEEAGRAYEKALAARGDFAPYWVRLCEVRLAAGDCGAAREAAGRARTLEAGSRGVSCLARAQVCLGQVDESSDEVRGAWPWDLVAIGDFFRDHGDSAKGRAYYARSRLASDDPKLAVSLSELELRESGAAQAWAVLQPALVAHPQDPDALAQAAAVRRGGGQNREALGLAAQALEARLDGKTLQRLQAAFGDDAGYSELRRRVTERVEGLFDYYEKSHDYQNLRRDLSMTQWVIGHAGATYKDREAVPHLIRYLAESPFAETRARAADALWWIGDRQAVPAMLRALSDPDLKVQGFAASGLGDLGDPAAVAPLLDLFGRLQDNREQTKARVADALGKLRDQRALAPIRESLAKIKDPSYQAWAQGAVARLEAQQR